MHFRPESVHSATAATSDQNAEFRIETAEQNQRFRFVSIPLICYNVSIRFGRVTDNRRQRRCT